MTLVHISFITFTAYVACMIALFGVPASISETYYLLDRKRRGLGWLFTGFCWLVAGALLPPWLDMTPDTYRFVPFLAAAGLMFVGAAPQFKVSLSGPVHFIGAGVCCVFAGLWVILSGAWWMLPATYGVCLALGSVWHKWMFWIEIAAFASTFLTIATIQ